jgi:hypothetical protein
MVEKRGATPFILNLDTKLKVQVNSTLPPIYAKEKRHRHPPKRNLDGLPKPAWVKKVKQPRYRPGVAQTVPGS